MGNVFLKLTTTEHLLEPQTSLKPGTSGKWWMASLVLLSVLEGQDDRLAVANVCFKVSPVSGCRPCMRDGLCYLIS